uniref:Transmembrane protein n=1 Tax=Meloidogyne incognita TaxID=6306 RepID=A0A914LR19_MELIC
MENKEFPINNINFCIKTIPTLFNSNNNSQHFPSEEVNFTTAEHRKRHRRRNEILIPFSENYQKIRVISSNIKQHLLFKNSLPLERRQKPFWRYTKTINLVLFLQLLILFLILKPLSTFFLYSTASEISLNETNSFEDFEENIYQNFTENIWRFQQLNNYYKRVKRKNDWKQQKLSKQLFTKMGLIEEKGLQLEMCHVWNKGSPSELCALNRWERIKRMDELSLFTICAEGFSNLQLSDIFQLNVINNQESESSLISFVERHLKLGQLGQSCILGDAHSSECLICFERLGTSLEKLEKTFWSFSQLLQRFDCRQQQKDLEKENTIKQQQISTTRPFSPNTTCDNCAEWYRKWLLVNLVEIWKRKVCINWCYYTQLACPHLATNKVVEFAGHPVFLCRDQMLSTTKSTSALDCSCLHPCDLIRNKIAQFTVESEQFNSSSKKQPITTTTFDFFHVSAYCQKREKRCRTKTITKKKN